MTWRKKFRKQGSDCFAFL